MRNGEATAVADAQGRPPMPAARGRHYLYAIIAGGEPRTYSSPGIEAGNVYTITDGHLSAVVSALASPRVRPERAHLTAHQAVLKRLMAESTPLPMAFGTVAANPDAIRGILARNQQVFQEQLQRVAGKVEMGLRVAWEVPNIFEYFVNTHAELRAARDRLVAARHEFTQEEKIELGRQFDHLLQADRENYTRKVERVLAPVCAEFRSNPCRSEFEVMNLACLVPRGAQEEFSTAVFEAAQLFDNNFSFDYSGPWAPHNFVEIDVRA